MLLNNSLKPVAILATLVWLCGSVSSLPAAESIKDPQRARLKNNEGMNFYRIGQYEMAVKKFEEAVALEPKYLRTRLNLASTLALMGDAAFKAYVKGVVKSNYPKNTQKEAWQKYISIRLKAIEVLNTAYEMDPEKTLKKLRTDPDYRNLRQTDEFEDSAIGKALKAQIEHYHNPTYGFAFNYPTDYKISLIQGSEIILKMEKPDYQGGEMGFGYPLSMSISRFRKLDYKHERRGENPHDSPAVAEAEIVIAGLKAKKIEYDDHQAEDGKGKIRQIEVVIGDDLYMIDFEYGLTGCFNVGEAYGKEECEKDNRIRTEDSERAMSAIVDSFQFSRRKRIE